MTEDQESMSEGDRMQGPAGSQSRFDPVLREQIETSLHAGYAWNAKYAKYGIIWVWFFWVLKWGFAIATIVALIGSASLLIRGPGESANWFLWLASSVPLLGGAFFFGAFQVAMQRAHDTELKMAESYTAPRSSH